MSGGTFDNKQYHITDIVDEIEQLVLNETKKEKYNINHYVQVL
jgi:hypothetical protein